LKGHGFRAAEKGQEPRSKATRLESVDGKHNICTPFSDLRTNIDLDKPAPPGAIENSPARLVVVQFEI